MYLRRELILISDKLSPETLNANTDDKDAEKYENTESLIRFSRKRVFLNHFLNLTRL